MTENVPLRCIILQVFRFSSTNYRSTNVRFNNVKINSVISKLLQVSHVFVNIRVRNFRYNKACWFVPTYSLTVLQFRYNEQFTAVGSANFTFKIMGTSFQVYEFSPYEQFSWKKLSSCIQGYLYFVRAHPIVDTSRIKHSQTYIRIHKGTQKIVYTLEVIYG